MDLLQLRYFITTAKTGKIAETAEQFIVSPSSVSKSISRLENELNAKLFDRTSNSIFLNKNGQNFYRYIEKAISLIDEGVDNIYTAGGETSDKITILTYSNSLAVHNCAAAFKKLHPQIFFDIADYSKGSTDPEKYDLLISTGHPGLPGLDSTKIGDFDITVIVSIENPLARYDEIDISLLKDQLFISDNKSSRLWKTFAAICRSHGFEPRVSLVSNHQILRTFVRQNLGCAVELTLVKSRKSVNDTSSGIIHLYFKDTVFRTSTYVFRAKNAPQSESVNLFFRFLQDNFENPTGVRNFTRLM